MSDREPPERNRAAEEHVLGAILLEPERWPQVADLELANFAFPAHRAIFQSFAELAANGGIGSVEHVVEHLEKTGRLKVAGGPEAIQRLHDDTSTAATISHYADVLRQVKHGPDRKSKRSSRAKPPFPSAALTLAESGAVLDDGSAFVRWQSMGLDCNGNGQPFATLSNANLVLRSHPAVAGKIWLDRFDGRIYHAFDRTPKPWRDADALKLTAWLQQTLQLSKIGVDLMHQAVSLCAENNARNSLTDWLDSLAWDGEPRLAEWLSDFLGVARTEYTQAVACNFLISMVARAYRPGCQADHMPVLEGASGAGKSSALAILGGRWYGAAPQAFGSRDFIEAIQGSWLIEIPDMVGFGRREHSQIIAAITTRVDIYRPPYGRHVEEHPRRVIFAATSETDEYLQDSRGKRRYWPIQCGAIDLQALERARDRLFAEAVAAFKQGASWHEVPLEEAREVQSHREETDVWIEKISDYISGRTAVSLGDVATEGLRLDYGRQDRATQMRISKCLKQLGFSTKVERVGTKIVRMYRRS